MKSNGTETPKRPLVESLCVFDFFVDLPHPAASSKNERARIIEPPGECHPGVAELFDPAKLSRIAMFAFPDYNPESDKDEKKKQQGGILNIHDRDIFATNAFHLTFSLLLDSGVRVYAHVLRHLTAHHRVKTRLDVGRRAERAFVILTRAVGGEEFYRCLLRTIQAISIHNLVVAGAEKKQNILTAFLHTMYKRHFVLRTRCSESLEKNSMKLLPEEFKKISIHGTEMYFLLFHDEDENKRRMFMNKDVVSFRLPQSLQPGYDANNFSSECEDQDSPILPLLRCLGTGKTIRLLGALLCEVRLIVVSKYVDTLSSCVRAAMALLSQGLLVWRHVSITVLPPHLFRFLSAGAPYIVGVLDQYVNKIEGVKGLKDVLSINLDTGNMKVYNMNDPKKTIPDLMESKIARKQKNKYMGIEMLAKDFNEVLEADRKLWSPSRIALEAPDATVIISNNKKSAHTDREDTSRKDDFFDAAELFVKTMKESTHAAYEKERSLVVDTIPKNSGATELVCKDVAARPITKRPFTVCNNDQGEEMMRASLICFFLELYGDIGMYLLASKISSRALKVDKKKFLVRKSQMGVVENSPMWHVLKQFSRSIMFERYVNSCIEDAERHKKSQNSSRPYSDFLPLPKASSKE